MGAPGIFSIGLHTVVLHMHNSLMPILHWVMAFKNMYVRTGLKWPFVHQLGVYTSMGKF